MTRHHGTGKRARLAWHLSFWMPGLGQLYKGEWVKGVVLLAASMLLSRWIANLYPFLAIRACLPPACPALFGTDVTALLIVWVWGIYDAGQARATGWTRVPGCE